MAKIKQALSENLKKYMKAHALSQSELARRVKTSINTINSIVHGKSGGSEQVISGIAKVFGIEETELFKDPSSLEENQEFQELIAELKKVSEARRAFLLETWLFEIRELERRSEMRAKRSLKIPE